VPGGPSEDAAPESEEVLVEWLPHPNATVTRIDPEMIAARGKSMERQSGLLLPRKQATQSRTETISASSRTRPY
jgi:hypothetical protein